jgi:hypothetical protein
MHTFRDVSMILRYHLVLLTSLASSIQSADSSLHSIGPVRETVEEE